MTRTFAIAALCLLCSSDVIADGIWNPTTQFVGSMGQGISNPIGVGAPPVVTASLDFSDANNSQYMPLLGGFP